MREILTDLAEEHESLDRLVADLPPEQWDLETPAEGWTIRDQIGHLAHFDEQAVLAATDPGRFQDGLNNLQSAGCDPITEHLETGRSMPPRHLLEWWRTARSQFLDAMANVEPETRIPWYGPPMRASSSVVARLMETWAHGTDIADTLGVTRAPTDRLFHIAELGIKTFRFAFETNGQPVPDERVRVALRGPDGVVRVWNDTSNDSITGPVEEFCLVVAQRLHVADTHLVLEGDLARGWMEVAQIFAGPPGQGRPRTGDIVVYQRPSSASLSNAVYNSGSMRNES